MTDREAIAAKIRALLAKTVANGCSEDEAVAAATKAAELLQRYNLALDEVHLRASPFAQDDLKHENEVGRRLWKPADAIAALTGTTHWMSKPGVHPYENTFFGFKHEVEIASYLLNICASAMRSEHDRIVRESFPLHGAKLRQVLWPFLDGMADRLRARILALRPPKATGTGLVVVRDQLIEAELTSRGMKFTEARARPSRDNERSYQDGLAAADRVALNAGVAGPSGQRARLR